MQLSIRHDHAGTPDLHVAGEVDMATSGDLEEAVSRALAGCAGPTLIVDFTDVTFCDSSGLAVLDRAYGRAAERGMALRLTNLQPSVRRVLEITGMLTALTKG